MLSIVEAAGTYLSKVLLHVHSTMDTFSRSFYRTGYVSTTTSKNFSVEHNG